jgi:hypothetical protein
MKGKMSSVGLHQTGHLVVSTSRRDEEAHNSSHYYVFLYIRGREVFRVGSSVETASSKDLISLREPAVIGSAIRNLIPVPSGITGTRRCPATPRLETVPA